jgi:hypothetical protein
MSANLDLVRSIYADWECGDFSKAEWEDPGIEHTADFIGATWKGLAGMAEGARGVIEAIEHQRLEAEDYRNLGDERVLMFDRRAGTAKHSGMEFGESTVLPSLGAHLFHIRSGKVTKLVAYGRRDRALADLGLEA